MGYLRPLLAVITLLATPGASHASGPFEAGDIAILFNNGLDCYVMRMDPKTYDFESLFNTNLCEWGVGMAFEAPRTAFLVDHVPGQATVYELDLETGSYTPFVTSADFIGDVALEADGDLILNYGFRLVRVDRITKQQTVITDNQFNLNHILVAQDDTIYASVGTTPTITGGIARIDPTGNPNTNQNLVSYDGLIESSGPIAFSRKHPGQLILLQGLADHPLLHVDLVSGAQTPRPPPGGPGYLGFGAWAIAVEEDDDLFIAQLFDLARVDGMTGIVTNLNPLLIWSVYDVELVRPACDNGLDDDRDGLIDSADPGCKTRFDISEKFACQDGFDNDGNGATDMTDGACSSPTSDAEFAACADGLDNDLDGKIDLDDPGCQNSQDSRERYSCNDSIDNDGDGPVDMADADCTTPTDRSEKPACSDGLDNDGDKLIDLGDPDCSGPSSNGELPACNDGIDNDGDLLIDQADPGCRDLFDASEHYACSDGIDNDEDGLNDHPDDPDCISAQDDQEFVNCYDGLDNDMDGLIDLADPSCSDTSNGGETPECSDGIDNDGDGNTDYPSDTGCESSDDPSEQPQCNDGIDNDGDGDVDLQDDHCKNIFDNTELAECQDGIDNDGDGGVDFAPPPDGDAHCSYPTDDREKGSCGLGFELMLLLLLIGRRSRKQAGVVLTGMLAIALVAPTALADTGTSLDDSSGEGGSRFAGLAQAPEANLYSGAMSMSVPILVPPGRKNATPELALSYSSSGGEGPFGRGWTLSLGSIERSTKRGNLVCDDEWPYLDDFILSLNGSTVELVADTVDPDLYRPRIDGSYLEATADKVNNEWEVKDRSGMTYRFGTHSDARFGKGAPDAFYDAGTHWLQCRYTSFWGLTQIEDPNGNTIDITWDRDLLNNYNYPLEVAYGANPDAGLSAHPFRVTFHTAPRQFPRTSNRRGTAERIHKLVNQITVEYAPTKTAAQAGNYQTVRTYDLGYDEFEMGGRAQLVSITDPAGLLPAQTFEYSTGSFAYSAPINYYPPSYSGLGNTFLRNTQTIAHQESAEQVTYRSLMDMNADGFIDLVVANEGAASVWKVYRGTPNGFESSAMDWDISALPADFDHTRHSDTGNVIQNGGCGYTTDLETMDFTGDGFPDFVDARVSGTWDIYPGECTDADTCQFGAKFSVAAEKKIRSDQVDCASTLSSRGVFDLNGDGLLDYDVGTHGVNLDARINLGGESGFIDVSGSIIYGASFRDSQAPGSTESDTIRDVFDFNGDGFPDMLLQNYQDKACIDSVGNVRHIDIEANCGPSEGTGSLIYIVSGDDWRQEVLPFELHSIRWGDSGGAEPGVRQDFFDVNGDGLPDRVYWNAGPGWGDGGSWAVQMNTGSGLELPVYSPSSHHGLAAPRTIPSIDGPIRRDEGLANSYSRIELLDWNGDGFIDRVDASAIPWKIQLGGPVDGLSPGLLLKAHNGLGGTTEVRYTRSSEFDNTGGDGVVDLPTKTWVITGIRKTDGLCTPTGSDLFDPSQNSCIGKGHETIQLIEYEGGLFDSEDREFRGFRTVWQDNSVGDTATGVSFNTRRVVFDQGDFHRGRTLTSEIFAGDDVTGTLVSRETNLWDTRCPGDPNNPSDHTMGPCSDPTTERTQTYLAAHQLEEFSLIGESSLDRCLLNRNHAPDDWGRVSYTCSQACSGGTPTIALCTASPQIDQVDTVTTWANPIGDSSQRERPSSVKSQYFRDNQGTPTATTLSWKWFYYDGSGAAGLGLGQVYNGNLKKVLSFLDQSYAGIPVWPVVLTSYDDFGNVRMVTDPEGNVSESIYTEDLFELYPTTEKTPLASLQQLVTTDLRFGKPLSITDYNLGVTQYQYDGLGRITCEARPGESLSNCLGGGNFTHAAEYVYQYGNPAGPSFEEKLSYVEVRTREPDAPNGFIASRAYSDALGRKRATLTQRVIGNDPSLRWLALEQGRYDAAGSLMEEFVPYLATPGGGTLGVVENPTGGSTLYSYALNGSAAIDPMGRPHEVIQPDGKKTQSFFEGVQTRVVHAPNTALAGEVRTTTDALGRVTLKESGAPDFTTPNLWFTYSLDGMGRTLSEEVSGDATTLVTRRYDTLGREIELIDPDSGSWKTGYDGNGNRIFRDDPKTGQHVQWRYDALDRVTHTCIFADDSYTDLEELVGCDSATQESAFTYDEFIASGGGNKGRGRLTHVSHQNGGQDLKYDIRGRVVEDNRAVLSKTTGLAFIYNSADRVTSIFYPDAEQVDLFYDAAGQLIEISNFGRKYVRDVHYELLGRPSEIVHGNWVSDHRVYAPAGMDNFRLKSLLTENLTGDEYLAQIYNYNDLGKIETVLDSLNNDGSGIAALSNDAGYSYDRHGRLTGVDWLPSDPSATAHDDAFDFSPIGNLTLKGGSALTYAQNGAGPHQVTSYNGTSISYDANGNQDLRGTGVEARDYTFDALNRLVAVALGDGTHVEYRYDHAGTRVAKRVNGGPWTRYFSRYAESRKDGSQGQLVKYYFAGAMRIASLESENNNFVDAAAVGSAPIEPWYPPAGLVLCVALLTCVLLLGPSLGQPLAKGQWVAPSRALGSALLILFVSTTAEAGRPRPPGPPPPVVHHYHLDHLGSTQAMTNASGSLVRQARYDAYGEIRGRFDGLGNSIGHDEDSRHEFTGYETEIETGLQYAGVRYYDPELGQFLGLDPARQFASPFSYMGGDPMNGTDPDGAFAILDDLAVILVLAAAFAAIQAAVIYAQTGSFSTALKGFATNFAIGVAAGVIIGPIAASNPSTQIGIAAKQSFMLGMTGYAGYGTANAIRNEDALGAVFAGIGLIGSAHGFAKSLGGSAASKTVSGDSLADFDDGHSASLLIQSETKEPGFWKWFRRIRRANFLSNLFKGGNELRKEAIRQQEEHFARERVKGKLKTQQKANDDLKWKVRMQNEIGPPNLSPHSMTVPNGCGGACTLDVSYPGGPDTPGAFRECMANTCSVEQMNQR